jgi:nucleotide-binding universal stress UspA family protein
MPDRRAACKAVAVIFDRVICGVDPSEQSLEAVRQAARLVAGNGRLLLLGVVEMELAAQAGWAAGTVAEQLQTETAEAVERAHAEITHLRLADTRVVEGSATARFEEEIAREKATLVAIGTHGHRRSAGFLLGSLTTMLLHDAPCAVLVARPVPDPAVFPAAIVAGVDGSPQGETAAVVAGVLGERFGASVSLVTASGAKNLDLDAVRAAHPGVAVLDGRPVDALVAASEGADLVLVGSRGLHGVKALGSVSERVAHQARCSVLVVR